MKSLLKFVVVLLVLVLIGGAAALVSLSAPYKGFGDPVFIDIAKGTGTSKVAEQLEAAGVVRSRYQFMLARALKPRARLQAGEYQFTKPTSTYDAFSKIVRGDVFYYELTVPEGHNLFDISQAVSNLGIITAQEFIAEARNPALIRDLDAKAPTLEGYLYPSTYRLTRSTTAHQICKLMTDQFRKQWRTLKTQNDIHRIVTMASLIEKETSIDQERPIVSSVYWNRLEKNMLMGCDPTVIYAALLEKRWRGTIYRSDLDYDHPYNTYVRPGLPPGPIANPGIASIKAALAPAKTDYLFFVARGDGSGGHTFSIGAAQHNKAVEAYRRSQQHH